MIDKLLGLRSFVPELLLLMVLGVVFGVNTGVFDIDPYAELFYIEAAKETLGAGHFWLPVLNNHDYLMRSPFWIWLVTLCFKMFGVSLWAARLPSVLCALGGLGLIYMLTMELTKRRFAAFFAAAVLGTSWGYFHMASLSTADILTTDIYLGFAWALVLWHSLAARRHTLPIEINLLSGIMGALLGLLILVKGTVSVLLLLSLAVAYLVLNHNLDVLRKLNLSLLLLPTLLVPLLWLIGASIGSGNASFISQYLLVYPWEQLTGGGIWQGLVGDPLFYLKRLPLDWMPYLIFVPALVMDRAVFEQRQGSHWALWVLCWLAVGFLVYSFSAFQEPTLLLPFYPPMAILVGAYLGNALESSPNADHTTYERTLTGVVLSMMAVAVLFAILIFQVLPSNYVVGFWNLPGQATVEFLKMEEAFPIWKFWLIPGPFIFLVGGLTLFVLHAGRRLTLTPFAIISTFTLFFLFVKLVYLPIVHRPVPEAFAAQINRQAKPGDEVMLYSLHPDVKRVWFYLHYNKDIPVRFIRKPAALEKKLADVNGTLFGVIREKSYFNDLDYTHRYQLQVSQFNWTWDANRMAEMKKFLSIRPPLFDKMKSDMISFQSLPESVRTVVIEEQIPVEFVPPTGRKRR